MLKSIIFRASTIMLMFIGVATASTAHAGDKTVSLSQDAIIGIAYIDSDHDSRNVFFDDYFPRVLPAITDAGGEVIAKFETIDVEEGELTPQYVLIIEWPSLDAFEAAAQDPRTVRNLALRTGAVRDFRIGFFTIPETTTLTFTENVVYEFFAGVPASAETPNQLQTFFQNVIPTAMQYGRADALILTPVQHERNTYFRPIAGLATWPTAAHFEQFTNTTVFRENVEQYRNPAFAELELINTYFVE